MYEFLKTYQLDIMLVLSGVCGIIILFVLLNDAISVKRKRTLVAIEFAAVCILISDRLAYIYRGDVSCLGYWMVRVSNFLVFFMSLFLTFSFNQYMKNLYMNEGGLEKIPIRLHICDMVAALGFVMLIISQYTGYYYTFDSQNIYSRGPGITVCYAIAYIPMLLQMSVIITCFKRLPATLSVPLLLFDILPAVATVVQLMMYGVSLQNITLAGMAVVIYVFAIFDMNINVKKAQNIEKDLLRKERKHMHDLFEQTASALVKSIDAKDKYTHGHSTRVANYSRMIAERAGMEDKDCEEVYFAGLLHDAGKIGIPDDIINKTSRLSDEEFDIIKSHPVIGGRILSRIKNAPYLQVGARYHHERYDGSGYPEGLSGEDIPEIARIIAVADAYDAMTSNRSYRDIMPQAKVREQVEKGMGNQFDPKFAAIMIQMIDEDLEYSMRENVGIG